MSYNHEEALKLFDEFCAKHANSLTDDMRKAVQFALEAHKGQVRKVNGAPYVSHLFDVAEILLKTVRFSAFAAACENDYFKNNNYCRKTK